MAKRITVEWMTDVPVEEDGSHDFDRATWAGKEFPGDAIKAARNFARKTAQANPFGQTWIRTEYAPNDNARDWEWERDYSADETIEAA